jgi:hypothetical protein
MESTWWIWLLLLLMAGGLIGSLSLFVLGRRDMVRESQRWRSDCKRIEQLQTELSDQIADVHRCLLDNAYNRPRLAAGRASVLRLAEKGERPHEIAAALGIGRGEVELQLKLHAMAAARDVRRTSEPAST